MKNKRHARRVKRLALICTMCTIILVVSTYAWFIGMRTVNVASFDVEIAATKGLYLSLDGKDWYETVSINQSNFDSTYTGNTNTWSEGGLIPVSTIGEISSTDSRLIMFEKGSLTTTDGGYRLMASKVDNTLVTTGTGKEGKGFVAFDLFIKNLSGEEYYADYNQLNEEAIYLTQASNVSVVGAGTDQELTGIENSVRVAFAQIGRVDAATTTQDTITKITCADSTDVTGICDRYAQIWEPNDKDHVQNAINWYNKSCVKRINADLTLSTSYSGDCKAVADGAYSQTYAVGSVIDYTDKIDVYDGPDYNLYTTSIKNYSESTYSYIDADSTIEKHNEVDGIGKISETTTGGLYAYDYFTDTEKMLTGMDRPTFMTLAPNSITKVRVYVYIEGQDVDNYDFASLGKKISVSFGFTKERFFDTDIDYVGPEGVPTTPETVSVVE